MGAIASRLDSQGPELQKANENIVRLQRQSTSHMMALSDAELELKRVKRAHQDQLKAIAAGGLAAIVLGVVASRRSQASTMERASKEVIDLKQQLRDLAVAEKFGAERLARSLLPTLDAMDSLATALPHDSGVQSVHSALHDALRRNGINPVAPALGERFDVANMEKAHAASVDDAAQVGTVTALLQPGYVLHGERLLRAAQVGVGTAAADAPDGA